MIRIGLTGRVLDLATITLVAVVRPWAMAAEGNPLNVTAYAVGGIWGIWLFWVAITAPYLLALAAADRFVVDRPRWPVLLFASISWLGPLSNLRGIL